MRFSASLWEITIKVSIGKLKLKGSLRDLKNYLNERGFKILAYDFDDLETLLKLPFHHQGPFDRLITAQAKTKSFEVIINDNQVQKYFY